MKEVNSLHDFYEKLEKAEKTALLLVKSGTENSDCAFVNLMNALNESEMQLLYADVSTVRDIHPVFNINSVPSLLIFSGTELKNVVKACQSVEFYRNLLKSSFFVSTNSGESKPAKNVTVYSTPTCSWCNTLKTWLEKNGVKYRDIDISRDQNAAQELVRRSGQQGVPQTDVNGRIVVGFDQNKLKDLLGI